MRSKLLMTLVVGALLMLCAGGAAARNAAVESPIAGSAMDRSYRPSSTETRGARLETLWIFDADFSTTTGDDAWTSTDRSGTLASANYWHHDTIRINGFAYLGDSTWWCGTCNGCWCQPRGYGNEWMQILERHFTESVGDVGVLTFEYDQRFAMEGDYDYGYVDVRSFATSDTWKTVMTVNNPGFAGKPGTSQDWDSTHPLGGGHETINITSEAGNVEFDLRFRFESDVAYSSQDEYNNPPKNSVQDGAWQLDNITLTSDIGGVLFYDDAESYGDNGWVHEDIEATGQKNVVFWRGRFGFEYDFVTGRSFTCDDRPPGSWMYAAVDPFLSTMVDGENTWLVSPPIDVENAPKLVGQWDMWVDLPRPTNDVFDLSLAADDLQECVTDPAGFRDESPGGWYGGPFWGVWTDDWDAFAGMAWLAIRWELWNDDPAEEPHMAGIFLNRQRVGIPSGDAGTTWNYAVWYRFNDWFDGQMADALLDSAVINVKDDDDIVSVTLIADNGITSNEYACRRLDAVGNDWIVPPPVTEMIPGAEIHYSYRSLDGASVESTFPNGYYEFSILPITATVTSPGLLLVDKHGRRTPGAQRDYLHSSEYYYREMLGILGYEWETYDVEVPSGSNEQSDGPDTSGYKYYDTQIWFTNEFDAYTIKKVDQLNLISWLNQSSDGKERNLLITGNDWGKEVVATHHDSQAFYATWMASEYIRNAVGAVTVDSVPSIKEVAGGWTFMNHDDGEAILRGACPQLHYYDVVNPNGGIPGTEAVLQYEALDSTLSNAGCAYTHGEMGYQTVNLGFGMEFMADGTVGGGAGNYTAEGYFHTGIFDRVNLMGNILGDGSRAGYFGLFPDGPGTGVVDGVKNELSHAYPNPFNPMTRIAYSVKEAGPVTITVYNVAGKVVRTLLDIEVEANVSGHVVWDGSNDGGKKCASGVYFYRIAAPGFTESRKMIMLK
ncbi:MAG: T9SS type A sorting domain-containing protein [Candidatus Eisenbacteria sp.]|nr:T9SS type A sorting domain-containing protein [Candidatus Eisenbacteria bacterium]